MRYTKGIASWDYRPFGGSQFDDVQKQDWQGLLARRLADRRPFAAGFLQLVGGLLGRFTHSAANRWSFLSLVLVASTLCGSVARATQNPLLRSTEQRTTGSRQRRPSLPRPQRGRTRAICGALLLPLIWVLHPVRSRMEMIVLNGNVDFASPVRE